MAQEETSMTLADTYKKMLEQLTDKEREVLGKRFPAGLPETLPATGLPEPEPEVDRIAVEMVHARKSFEKHEIVKWSEGRWFLKQPGTSTFWFEVVVLAGGYLLVHGDIQAVMFGCYHANENDTPHRAARRTVLWMGTRKRPDDGYFIEKAGIGGTADETIWTYDEDTLREEIAELIAAARESEAVTEPDTDLREELEEILTRVGDVSLEEIQSQVYDALEGDAESVPRGKLLSSSMVYAHAALQRLTKLLEAEVRHE